MNTNHSNSHSNSFHPALPDPEEKGLSPAPDFWAQLAWLHHAEDRSLAARHPVPLPSDIGTMPRQDIRAFLEQLSVRVPDRLDALADAEVMVLHRALCEALAACGARDMP